MRAPLRVLRALERPPCTREASGSNPDESIPKRWYDVAEHHSCVMDESVSKIAQAVFVTDESSGRIGATSCAGAHRRVAVVATSQSHKKKFTRITFIRHITPMRAFARAWDEPCPTEMMVGYGGGDFTLMRPRRRLVGDPTLIGG